MRLLIKIFAISFVTISCNSSKISLDKLKSSSSKNIEDKKKYWFRKDYSEDGIPGISIDKWYNETSKKVKNKIIVAVIDTQIDLQHEDLVGQFWKNEKEIPNNEIDDDNNGYVDDVNGWNFIGTKSKNYIVWANYEYVRVIRKYKKKFDNKNLEDINKEDFNDFVEYKRALKKYDEERAYHKNWLDALNYSVDLFPLVKDTLKHFFPKEDYNYKQLDSMYQKYKINDKTFRQRRLDKDKDLGALIGFMKLRFDFDEKTIEKLKNKREQVDSLYNKSINIDYNERLFIENNSESLLKGYGLNNLNLEIKGIRKYNSHNTEVSSVIAANSENELGIKGFSNNIKIMPLTISASGDEHDKDIALAIRYAVDNGAKVINMSFTKEFSLHKDWVFGSIKYAEKHNVLIVHCSGNDSYNIDNEQKYPNDNDYINSSEVANNFINVGSITNKLDSTFVSDFSNYGKKNVDLFAPGEQIYVAMPNNKYDYDSGTSLSAPMVSGTAALIFLYYPKLSVQDVKQIILESGTSYNIDVLVPGGEGIKLPFKELSKSGKVLNVYNAMKIAKETNKLKR